MPAGRRAGDVLQASLRHGAADAGAAVRLVGQLLRAFQRHPQLQHQHAGARPALPAVSVAVRPQSGWQSS